MTILLCSVSDEIYFIKQRNVILKLYVVCLRASIKIIKKDKRNEDGQEEEGGKGLCVGVCVCVCVCVCV